MYLGYENEIDISLLFSLYVNTGRRIHVKGVLSGDLLFLMLITISSVVFKMCTHEGLFIYNLLLQVNYNTNNESLDQSGRRV
jgi:hypothetical protein